MAFKEILGWFVISVLASLLFIRMVIVPIIKFKKGDDSELGFMLSIFIPIILAVLLGIFLNWAFS